MKHHFLPASVRNLMFAAAVVSQPSLAQDTGVTMPAGFVTHPVKTGRMNIIGVKLHHPLIASGSLERVEGKRLFDTKLGEMPAKDRKYLLEITSGKLLGVVQELVSWQSGELQVPEDLSKLGLVAGDAYAIRPATTLHDVFGAHNSYRLASAAGDDPAAADLVMLPQPKGKMMQYFYSNKHQAWLGSHDKKPSNPSIVHTDAVVVLRKSGADLALTQVGGIKTTPSTYAIFPGPNFLGSTFAVQPTLFESQLHLTLASSNALSMESADLLLVPNAQGANSTYFYSSKTGKEGWYDAGTLQPADDVRLPSGFVIMVQDGKAKAVTIYPTAGVRKAGEDARNSKNH